MTSALLGFGTVFLLSQSLIGNRYQRQSRGKYRLREYFARPGAADADGARSPLHNLRRLAVAWARFLAPRRYTLMVGKKIGQANLPLRPEEFLAVQALGLVLGLLGGFLLGPGAVGALIWGGTGWLLPLFFLHRAKVKRAAAFNHQIGDALILMSNSLRAGYGFLQAIQAVGQEMSPPISEEFDRILKAINLGAGTEEALRDMAHRVKSDDWDLVLTAVLIQRQVGGNLAEMLENIAHTIRERVRIKQEIKTLTAQGRLSGIIISLLPLALGLFLFFSNPAYIGILFTHPLGKMMLLGAVAGQIIGILFVRRIIRIEV